MRAPSTPPGISNALRHQAAARERTYVGNGSVANADVIATEPSPKKIPDAQHREHHERGMDLERQRAEHERARHVHLEHRLAAEPIHQPAGHEEAERAHDAGRREEEPRPGHAQPTSCWA